MQTTMRGDKRVTPEIVNYEVLTMDECKALSGHANILDRAGKIARVSITSKKTWKRKPDIEIRCKFGLYEFFHVTISPDRPNTEFVKIIE